MNESEAEDVSKVVPCAPSRSRRLLGTVLPAVLVGGAIGGGLAFIKITADGADRDVTAAIREEDDPKPGKDPAAPVGKGRAVTELTKKLLPVPSGYRLGPDVKGMSNDGELTAEQLKRRLVAQLTGGTAVQRDRFGDRLGGMGVKGMAVRTYSADSRRLVVEVAVSQLTKPGATRLWHESFVEAARLTEREGPSFGKGIKAACFRPARASEDIAPGLRSMMCSGYVDDIVVNLTAQGRTDDLDAGEVAKLMRRQLNHLASPGRYV
ncbi:hypothetical protein [Streptomyces paludis]|uniref:Uncharacterized protein n=1 Tax=Streptomyces paludis TaxID=2282738 RepID=A0A345HRL0_9ACTN|nr:hypothetical protein [Streptomyces paludis]AXG79334.1 hypothetical protein DVK44_18620 [Streptomyces paludis]